MMEGFALISRLSLGWLVLTCLVSCADLKTTGKVPGPDIPPEPNPRGYVCYRTDQPITADGVIAESQWLAAPWTEYFVDIEGPAKPDPPLRTRAKLLWDDTNLYIAAELEEPHVWATLHQRDTVIFYDNDFEVFIDPDGDTHAYYELEVNALGTAWDLLLMKPYRDGGPPVNSWDIAGLKVGTHIDGTLGDPGDTDMGWTVEIMIPWSALKECAPGTKPPVTGDQWHINFSRVEWKVKIIDGHYQKILNPRTGKALPEDNWVWSPQGRINMHMPEMWGVVQFSSIIASTGTETLVSDSDFPQKWVLRKVYYAEFEYYKQNRTYSANLEDIGLSTDEFQKTGTPTIRVTGTTFESYFPTGDGSTQGWTIHQDGRLFRFDTSHREN